MRVASDVFASAHPTTAAFATLISGAIDRLRKLSVTNSFTLERVRKVHQVDAWQARRLAQRLGPGAGTASGFHGRESLLITSERFLELETLPGHLALVGGGYIAAEFSHIAARADARVVRPTP